MFGLRSRAFGFFFGTVFLCYRSDHLPVLSDVFLDGGQMLVDHFVDLSLFVHVKGRQPVVHHAEHIDIVHRDAAGITELLGQFAGTAVAVAIRQDQIEIIAAEIRFLQKLTDLRWHLMPIDWRDDTELLAMERQQHLMDDLWDADGAFLDRSGHRKIVSGSIIKTDRNYRSSTIGKRWIEKGLFTAAGT